ncbi:hypothetical protein C1645_746008 [Glomus cerebriforme]|uniref:Uncharacterized protein n=1 Tax=Glomus cerebriforme TaxID=658196 RepID=A0A397S3J2_9GLOM|nr:hypothetical protein C1645_746008 [Glomus cerebriforme]
MTTCEQCLKPITGKYVYSPDKNDGKKFCSTNCMYEHYGRKCDKCGKVQGTLLDKDAFVSGNLLCKVELKGTKKLFSYGWGKNEDDLKTENQSKLPADYLTFYQKVFSIAVNLEGAGVGGKSGFIVF